MHTPPPPSRSHLGRIAAAAARCARALFPVRRAEAIATGFLPTLPGNRSVPLPIAALTALLNGHPAARARLKHLALIEASYHLSPQHPFANVPPRALAIAIRQLEPVLDRHHGLHVLRLQLERQLQTHRARVDAALALEDRRWRPDAGASTFGPLALDATGSLAFAETLPLETALGR